MVNLEITRLDANEDGFSKALARKLDWASVSDQKVISSVTGIIEDVRTRGDEALLEYTGQFDGLSVQSAGELVLGRERIRQALASVSPEKRQALELAAERIRNYHEHQKQDSWSYTEADGTLLGQQITPLDRVGLYVPGGKASYPSSVLMNAIPAKVAGVPEVVVTVPAPGGDPGHRANL